MSINPNPDRLDDLRAEYAQTGMVTSDGAVWLFSQVVVLREQVQRLKAEAAVSVVPPATNQTAPVDRAAVLREAADELGRMDYDTDSHDYGYDTYRDAWNGGVMDGADLLRRLAAEAPHTVAAASCVCGEPATLGTVHRADGPCYIAEAPHTETPDEAPPVCEGFVWIGQSFATCDRCAQPAWDHEGEEVAVEGAGPFDTRRTVRPWKPGQADAIRAKWGAPAVVAQPGKETDRG